MLRSKVYAFVIVLVVITYPCIAQHTETKTSLIAQRERLLQQLCTLQQKINALEEPSTTYNTSNRLNYSTNKIRKSRSTRTSSKIYHQGPRGGCYYINRNGNKTYVDRKMCY